VESAKLAGTYKEPQAPPHVRRREEMNAYMREYRRKRKSGHSIDESGTG
jgi:predicted metal-binding protein